MAPGMEKEETFAWQSLVLQRIADGIYYQRLQRRTWDAPYAPIDKLCLSISMNAALIYPGLEGPRIYIPNTAPMGKLNKIAKLTD